MVMKVFIWTCVVGACLAWPRAQQDPYDPLYQDPPQYYQDEPRYPIPAPKADQYRPQPPKYQKYPDDEVDEDYEEHGNTIPGEPGKDYPIFAIVPSTSFSCSEKLPGFYADGEAQCQVWHYCKTDGLKESFLCPNGTIYNQDNRVCEWWFNVSCDMDRLSQQARVNEDLYIVPSPKPDQPYGPNQAYPAEDQYQQPPPRPSYQREYDQGDF
ncbi:uncharacterized protein LOC127009238 [Eriocheir sinensis]|uniref:uncharacterized protein LOC127009238 n=1 Tax=Eriocheir sinensis TaxID=95602 RepID=UPI0021C5F823|nr:uncharacterized protein LOC127009238 [Eriocheir sinensis]XP_050738061.1 uncharacterized protein LOC127009238 [Eriocheir sinensis]XP_050738062.1 uncharacterized protein LOC127009238 [Eriocheir sinensis]